MVIGLHIANPDPHSPDKQLAAGTKAPIRAVWATAEAAVTSRSSPRSRVESRQGRNSFAYRIALDERIGLPSATQAANSARSASLSASGLSMNTGRPASTNGLARSTCSEAMSVAITTASTCPITSVARSTTWGIREQRATCSAVKPPSPTQWMWVTVAPGIVSVSADSFSR